MPNEIFIQARLSYNPATEDSVSIPWLEKFIDVTGSEYMSGVQSIGTSEEAIEKITDIGTVGICVFINLDASNYVEIGLTSSYTVKLKPKEFCLFRASADLYAKADTDAVRLKYWIFED